MSRSGSDSDNFDEEQEVGRFTIKPYQFEPRVDSDEAESHSDGDPGGVLGKILMGVCRWDSETLNLYQTTFMSFLQPYSRLDAKNPYPIPD